MNKEFLVKTAITELYNDIVGGAINTTYDFPKESKEYKQACELLNGTQEIEDCIYNCIASGKTCVTLMSGTYVIEKNMRFMGKEKLLGWIKHYVANNIVEDRKDICEK